uniref:Antifreeze protein n=1 Tax=Romanomermis culicivorax TaxID=13658 RepID=A0A915I4J0_ROMCU
LLNEPFEIEALTAANLVLSAPAALRILGPEVAQRALEFITNRTFRATPVDKILLDAEPSSPAVDAVTTTTGAQTLAAIAQQHPVAAVKSPTKVPNAFGEMLRAINDDLSIIEASLFPMATTPQSPKIGVLREVHLCGGLVVDFPGEELISSDDDDKE